MKLLRYSGPGTRMVPTEDGEEIAVRSGENVEVSNEVGEWIGLNVSSIEVLEIEEPLPPLEESGEDDN